MAPSVVCGAAVVVCGAGSRFFGAAGAVAGSGAAATTGAGAFPLPLPLVTAGAEPALAAAVAPLLPSSKATSVPALTLSPIFTFSSEMTPAAGAGTSSVA
jgi:hypothetical protein